MSEQELIKKLEPLLAKKMLGKLSAKGEQQLISLLKGNGKARAYYFDYCELSTLLEEDPDLFSELVADRLPQNVVPLSDEHRSKASLSELLPSELQREARSGRGMSRDWWSAAAAAVAIALLGLMFFASAQVDEDSLNLVGLDNEKQAHSEVVGVLPPESVTPVERAQKVEALVLSLPDQHAPVVRVDSKVAAEELVEVQEQVLAEEEEHDSNPMDKYESMLLTAVVPGSLKRPPTPFTSEQVESKKISFNRDIRPLLSDNCYHCHGPDKGSREAELRLDLPEQVFADRGEGKPLLVKPGEPAESDLYRRLIARDPDDLMPPGDSHKVLKPQQIAKIKKWIEQGAEWESHWAFIVPEKKPLPVVKGKWGVNAIDQFILATLEEEGLSPSPEADRRTLVRRVTFDATGLPPTPAAVEAFVDDRSDNAYEKLVDGLLDSPRYGEHRARYWLDAARYGDTHGLHLDNYRSIWPYRDWVIRAYNSNMPFDQFTIEQLAGDLLPNATQDQLVATGFNRCNVTTSEGGSIEEEVLSRYAIDRVATTGSVWLGLTLGCTQCHDHKFDPIKQKEFYQMVAYFNNTIQPGMDGNLIESPPSIRVYASPDDKKKVELLQVSIDVKRKELAVIKAAQKKDFKNWLKDSEQVLKAGASLRLKGAELDHSLSWKDTDSVLEVKDVGVFSKSKPFSISMQMVASKGDMGPGRAVVFSKVDTENGMRGYRLVWEDESLILELIERWPDLTLRRGTTRKFTAGKKVNVLITYDGSGSSEGIRFYVNGVTRSRDLLNWSDTMEGDFTVEALLQLGGKPIAGQRGTKGSSFQIYNRQLNAEQAYLLYTLRSLKSVEKKEKRSPAEEKSLWQIYALTNNENYSRLFVEVSKLESQKSAIKSLAPETLVWKEKDGPAKAFVLDRGEYDKPKEEVSPGVIKALNDLPQDAPKNRLGLARWLMARENPLTSRVMVNRFWGELFGTGLVKTAGDFGAQGVSPSHPELLDWLALSFMDSGWDVKAIYKKMLLSATYRQSSRVTPELREKDPANTGLARGPRFRLDAEMIRDQALLAGSVLVNKIGGPAVKPYQPSGLWSAVGYSSSNTQLFSQDHGKALYRRSIYTFIKRTSPPPNMSLFNAPNRENCVLARERTNTPLQALVLMNDPQYVDAARHLAVRTVRSGKDLDERLAFMSRVLLARPLSGDDLAIMKESYQNFEKSYSQDLVAAKDLLGSVTKPGEQGLKIEQLASWVMMANQMLNLDEVINKN